MCDLGEHKIDETYEEGYSCEIICTCDQVFIGYSWQDVGAKYDQHLWNVEDGLN